MANETALSAELSNSKVAAIFADPASARETAARLRQALQLEEAQVQLISPGDPRPGRKLEPESRGIFRTMMRAHLRLGLMGAAAGAVLFAVLFARGIPYIVNSAVMAAAVLVGFGAVRPVSWVPVHPAVRTDPYITRVYARWSKAACGGRAFVLARTERSGGGVPEAVQ